jgi:hypothetical protein
LKYYWIEKGAFLFRGKFESLRALIATETAEFVAFSAISTNSAVQRFKELKSPQTEYTVN